MEPSTPTNPINLTGQTKAELREKIRQQFESAPYPSNPIEHTPEGHYPGLFIHCFATPYYLRYQRLPKFEDLVILDAGCGTGYTSLILAKANPGARIIGLDPSAESIRLAEARLRYHGITNTEFRVGLIEDLPAISQELGVQFDYINCDEVLYLLPDLSKAMQAIRSTLKPTGFLRGNLNNRHQRSAHYRGQELFQRLGLMEQNPGEMEIDLVIETLQALHPHVALRQHTWDSRTGRGGEDKELVLLNYLLQGDRGYTVPDLFEVLEQADFEFLSMVHWRQWELLDLFAEPENLPMFWQMTLPDLSLRQRLEVYELLNPVHRLMDFWAMPKQVEQSDPSLSISEWNELDWQQSIVQLHPVLQTPALQKVFAEGIQKRQTIDFGRIFPEDGKMSPRIDANLAACLWPLFEGPQTLQTLVDRHLQIEPIHPLTLKPRSSSDAWSQIQQLLLKLEVLLYVLLEPSAERTVGNFKKS